MTYLSGSGRERGGGIVREHSHANDQSRPSTAKKNLKVIDEVARARKATMNTLSSEEEATLNIQAALLKISNGAENDQVERTGELDGQSKILQSDNPSEQIGSLSPDTRMKNGTDNGGSGRSENQNTVLSVIYFRSSNSKDQLHSLERLTQNDSSSPTKSKERGWDHMLPPNFSYEASHSTLALGEESEVDLLVTDHVKNVQLAGEDNHEQIWLVHPVSNEREKTNSQSRISHFGSPPIKTRQSSVPFQCTTEIKEMETLTRLEKQIRWEEGKLAATEERLKRSLTTNSDSEKMSCQQLESMNDDIISQAKKNASKSGITKVPSQIDQNQHFNATMKELRERFDKEDFKLRRILRPYSGKSHLQHYSSAGRSRQVPTCRYQNKLDEEKLASLKSKILAQSYRMHGSDLMGVFKCIDKDGGGTISIEEFATHVRHLVPDVTEHEMHLMMRKLDSDGGGSIDINEFFNFIGGVAAERARVKEEIEDEFREKRLTELKKRQSTIDPSKDYLSEKFEHLKLQGYYAQGIDKSTELLLEKDRYDSDKLFKTLDEAIACTHKPKIAKRTPVEIRKPLERSEMLMRARNNHSRFTGFKVPVSSSVLNLDIHPDIQEVANSQQIGKHWKDVRRVLKISHLLSKREITTLFYELDCDHSGYVDKNELDRALKDRGIHLCDHQLAELMSVGDKNCDQLLSLHEFIDVWRIVAEVNHKIQKKGVDIGQVLIEHSSRKKASDSKKKSTVSIRSTQDGWYQTMELLWNEEGELEPMEEESFDPNLNLLSIKQNPFVAMLSQSISKDASNEVLNSTTDTRASGREDFLKAILDRKKTLRKTNILPKQQIKKIDKNRQIAWDQFWNGIKALGLDTFVGKSNEMVLGGCFSMSSLNGSYDTSVQEKVSEIRVEKKITCGELLGRGKFGAVYSGTVDNLKVALKVAQFNTDESSDLYAVDGILMPPTAVSKQFLREIRALNVLADCNYAIKLVGGVCKQPFFISLEYMDGGDLATSLEDDSWQYHTSLRTRLRIMKDVACGLGFLHDRGLVHRDVKPHNILLELRVSSQAISNRGTRFLPIGDSSRDFEEKWEDRSVLAKICDFGATVKCGIQANKCEVAVECDTSFDWLDKEVEPAGTSGYTAPEVLMSDQEVTTASDLFSYGICLWECTTSHRENVLKGKDGRQAGNYILNGVRPMFTANQPIFLQKIIQSAWSTEKTRRPNISILIQIIDELTSSPDAFLQLYNRRFFTDPPEGRKSKSGEEYDAINHNYNILRGHSVSNIPTIIDGSAFFEEVIKHIYTIYTS